MGRTEMPNFLVGLALLDTDASTRSVREGLRRRIESRSGVTPLGLDARDGWSGAGAHGILERRLSQWCLTELGFDVTPFPGQPGYSANAYARRWNGWVGYEEEVYRACAGLVGTLTEEEIVGICGPRSRPAAQALLRELDPARGE